MHTRKIEVEIDGGKKLVGFATSDPDYPRIDLYLDQDGQQQLLVASLEDSKDGGVRLISYADLTKDEPVCIQKIE